MPFVHQVSFPAIVSRWRTTLCAVGLCCFRVRRSGRRGGGGCGGSRCAPLALLLGTRRVFFELIVFMRSSYSPSRLPKAPSSSSARGLHKSPLPLSRLALFAYLRRAALHRTLHLFSIAYGCAHGAGRRPSSPSLGPFAVCAVSSPRPRSRRAAAPSRPRSSLRRASLSRASLPPSSHFSPLSPSRRPTSSLLDLDLTLALTYHHPQPPACSRRWASPTSSARRSSPRRTGRSSSSRRSSARSRPTVRPSPSLSSTSLLPLLGVDADSAVLVSQNASSRSTSAPSTRRASSSLSPPPPLGRRAPRADPPRPPSPARSDEMLKHDLLPDMRYPMIPGGVVVGEIVKAARQGQRKLKEGTRVVGASPSSLGLLFNVVEDAELTSVDPLARPQPSRSCAASPSTAPSTSRWSSRCPRASTRATSSSRRRSAPSTRRASGLRTSAATTSSSACPTPSAASPRTSTSAWGSRATASSSCTVKGASLSLSLSASVRGREQALTLGPPPPSRLARPQRLCQGRARHDQDGQAGPQGDPRCVVGPLAGGRLRPQGRLHARRRQAQPRRRAQEARRRPGHHVCVPPLSLSLSCSCSMAGE